MGGRDFKKELRDLTKVFSDATELDKNSVILELLNKNDVYAKILFCSFAWSVRNNRKVSLNNYVSELGEEYNSVKNWIMRFSKTELITITRKSRKFFYIHIAPPEKFEKKWLEKAIEVIKK